MKKLMIAAAIAGAVGMAQADFSPLEGFESWTAGQQIDISQGSPYYWNASGNDTNENYEVIETVVTNYLGTGDTALEGAGDNFLALTGVELLERYVLPQANLETETAFNVTSNLYIDTLVKFTVTEDDDPVPSEGDKLCVWVGITNGVTNVMVKAGFVTNARGNTEFASYVTTTTFTESDLNEWHRLTVVAYAYPEGKVLPLSFVIMLDGTPVSADISQFAEGITFNWKDSTISGFAANNQLFPSRIGYGGTDADTICSIGFKGSGAIDNLQFSETDPNPQQTGPTVDGTEPGDGTAFVAAATSGTTNILPQDWTLDGNAIKDGNGDTYATIPSFYTAALNNGTLTLTLNTTALPTIGEATVESETKEAIEVGAATFTATLTTTSTKLYYGLKVATSLDANATWTLGTLTQGTGEAMQISADKPSDGNGGYAAAGFYKVYVTDIAPVTP